MTRDQYITYTRHGENVIRAQDERKIDALNRSKGWSITPEELEALKTQHKKAINAGDYYKAACIEYQLTDMNYHTDVEKLQVSACKLIGEYKAREEILEDEMYYIPTESNDEIEFKKSMDILASVERTLAKIDYDSIAQDSLVSFVEKFESALYYMKERYDEAKSYIK